MIHTANFAALFGRVANAQLLALMRPKPVGYCKTGVNGSDVDTIRAACERQVSGYHSEPLCVRTWPIRRRESKNEFATRIVIRGLRSMNVVLYPKQSAVYRTIKIVWVLGPVGQLTRKSTVIPVLSEAHLLGDYSRPNDTVWFRWVHLFAGKGQDEFTDFCLSSNAWLADCKRNERPIVVRRRTLSFGSPGLGSSKVLSAH